MAYDTTVLSATDTTSVTVGSNADRLLCCEVISTSDPSGVTYNGVSMTLMLSDVIASIYRRNYYYLVAPATGTHDLVISGTTTLGMTAHSLYDIHQASPIRTSITLNSVTGTANSRTLATVVGDTVVDWFAVSGGADPVSDSGSDAGHTIRTYAAGGLVIASATTEASTTSTYVEYTWSGSFSSGLVSVAFAAAGVVGSATAALGLGVVATGVLAIAGAASAALGLGVSALGALAITGSATAPLGLGVSASGAAVVPEFSDAGVITATLTVRPVTVGSLTARTTTVGTLSASTTTRAALVAALSRAATITIASRSRAVLTAAPTHAATLTYKADD